MSAQLPSISTRRSPNDFYLYHPTRTPDWRFRLALRRLEEHPRSIPSDVIADAVVRIAYTFLQLRRTLDAAARPQLRVMFPGLFDAFGIFESLDPTLRLHLECRLLAGQTDREIAEKLQVSAETIKWYQQVFFHVRDRMKASGWILLQVLNPVRSGKLSEHEYSLKNFAYRLGPIAFEWLLAAFHDEKRPRNLKELKERFVECSKRQISVLLLEEVDRESFDFRTAMRLRDLYFEKKHGRRTKKDQSAVNRARVAGVRATIEYLEPIMREHGWIDTDDTDDADDTIEDDDLPLPFFPEGYSAAVVKRAPRIDVYE